MLRHMLVKQPDGPLADLRGIPTRSCHGRILSRNKPSEKPGTIQCDLADTDLATCDNAEPVTDSGTTWVFTGKADSLTRQLITNASSYPTSGGRAWKGPYVDAIPALDPWGRSYLVNIANADPDAATNKWVVVISAGPDGNLDTAADTLGTANPTVGGDDVVARVK